MSSRSDLPATEADVRAAYRLLLGREPDPAGYRGYLDRVADASLTVRDLAEEFMKSPEYRAHRQLAQVDMGDGLIVVVDPLEPEFGRAIAHHRTWEPHIVATIERLLAPGATYVDIGANVGVMSFHAARRVGPRGKVIGFEPNADNVRCFLQGVEANGFQNVRLFPFAASARYGLFALEGSSNTHMVEAAAAADLVQAFPADPFLRDEARVDLIKIDIEGHEPHALAGLAETIARHRPTVLCEFNPRCLRDHIGQDVGMFAETIFAGFGDVTAIEHDGNAVRVADAEALLTLWSQRNRAAVESGLLPDGMLHFDLLLRSTP